MTCIGLLEFQGKTAQLNRVKKELTNRYHYASPVDCKYVFV